METAHAGEDVVVGRGDAAFRPYGREQRAYLGAGRGFLYAGFFGAAVSLAMLVSIFPWMQAFAEEAQFPEEGTVWRFTYAAAVLLAPLSGFIKWGLLGLFLGGVTGICITPSTGRARAAVVSGAVWFLPALIGAWMLLPSVARFLPHGSPSDQSAIGPRVLVEVVPLIVPFGAALVFGGAFGTHLHHLIRTRESQVGAAGLARDA